MNYRLLIDEADALPFITNLPAKSRRIILEKLLSLEKDPFPGAGGDKELIKAPKGRSEEKYIVSISHIVSRSSIGLRGLIRQYLLLKY